MKLLSIYQWFQVTIWREPNKNKKAKELSIPIISEEEFIARFLQMDENKLALESSPITEGSLF